MARDANQLDLFLPHAYHGHTIEQRAQDGYINATAMCDAARRPWGRYWETRAAKEFADALSADIGIPISDLIQSIRGGPPHRQGTWVHPQVAVHLAQWLSPRCAVLVSKWVYDWISGRGPRAPLPYHLRRYIANQNNVPRGHFSVLNEITLLLIAPMESQGYTLPERLWPDISQGKMFARWMRERYDVDTDAVPTYTHVFEDRRPPVQAKAYPNEWLAEFRDHFQNVWLPQRALSYFKEKDVTALPYLTPLLPSPDDEEDVA